MPQTDLSAPGGAAAAPHLVPFTLWAPAGAAGQTRDPVDLRGADQATGGAAQRTGAATSLLNLSERMAAHLAELGWPGAEPLRWAITAVDPQRGLRLEGIALAAEAGPPAGAGTAADRPAPGPRSR